MTIKRILAATAAVMIAGCGGSGSSADAGGLAEACPRLQGTALGNGVAGVTDAKVIDEGAATGSYCVVHVKFKNSALRFEARLPTTSWNAKLAWLGGGGFDGTIPNAKDAQFSSSILTDRYATIGTNGGHEAPSDLLEMFKAEFAYDAKQLSDFTSESEHRSLPLGKELIGLFYGKAPERSYFEGCSMGGHDALIQAQRYPDDFDGVVARAPAGNIMGLFMQFNRVSKQLKNSSNSLSPGKQALLAKAVLGQCDGLDGLVDGIIAKPGACNFNPAQLRCAGGGDSGDACLSDGQIATVNTITSPVTTNDGIWSHPGFHFGAENSPKGWGEYIWPSPALNNSLQGLFSDGFVRSFITRNPVYDTALWNANDWLTQMSAVGKLYDASNADLSGMLKRGSKLIIMNGTTDTSVSAKDNADYYGKVVARMGQSNADKVVEYFEAPGVGHCYGGVGPDNVDLLKAMSTWVEQGHPPSAQSLVLKKLDTTGATTLSRPMCKFPAYPRYKGGDQNSPNSFECSTV